MMPEMLSEILLKLVVKEIVEVEGKIRTGATCCGLTACEQLWPRNEAAGTGSARARGTARHSARLPAKRGGTVAAS